MKDYKEKYNELYSEVAKLLVENRENGYSPYKLLSRWDILRGKIDSDDENVKIKNIQMKVKVINESNNDLPQYETKGSAGMDVRAHLESGKIVIEPGERVLIKTGLKLNIPEGMELQVRPRSGLAYKHGITVLNSPGTIDSDYTGDCGVILINHGTSNFVVEPGDRIAQFVFAKYERIEFELSEELDATERGEGGFGSTGKK